MIDKPDSRACRLATFTLDTLCEILIENHRSARIDEIEHPLVMVALAKLPAEPVRHGEGIVYVLGEDDLARLGALVRSDEVIRASVRATGEIIPFPRGDEQPNTGADDDIEAKVARVRRHLDHYGIGHPRHFAQLVAGAENCSEEEAMETMRRRRRGGAEAAQILEHFFSAMKQMDQRCNPAAIEHQIKEAVHAGTAPPVVINAFLEAVEKKLREQDEEWGGRFTNFGGPEWVLREGLSWLRELHRTDNLAKARASKRLREFVDAMRSFVDRRFAPPPTPEQEEQRKILKERARQVFSPADEQAKKAAKMLKRSGRKPRA